MSKEKIHQPPDFYIVFVDSFLRTSALPDSFLSTLSLNPTLSLSITFLFKMDHFVQHVLQQAPKVMHHVYTLQGNPLGTKRMTVRRLINCCRGQYPYSSLNH